MTNAQRDYIDGRITAAAGFVVTMTGPLGWITLVGLAFSVLGAASAHLAAKRIQREGAERAP